MDIVLLAVLVVVVIALLISEVVPIPVVSLATIAALPALGILTPREAFSGLSSEATITVAAMFVLSVGLSRTGALEVVAGWIGKIRPGEHPKVLLLALAAVAAVPSAFLNNTPVVVLLVPIVLSLCRQHGLSPSKLLIPTSYFAILGGTATLVGSSTNILVDGIYRSAGGEGFGILEFLGMGSCFLIVGGTFIVFAADRLLPDRAVLSQLVGRSERIAFVTELVLPDGNFLVGKRLERFGGKSYGIKVIELVRGERVTLGPSPEIELEAGDSLLVEGEPHALHRLLEESELELGSAVADAQRVRINRLDLLMAEAVIPPNSSFIGQKLQEIGLNRIWGVKVLAVQRLGRHHRVRLRGLELQAGDVLLVQGEESTLRSLQERGSVLLVEGVESKIKSPQMAPRAIAIMATVMGLATWGIAPLSVLALAGCVAMLTTRCLRWRQAVAALDSRVLLLLAGTIPLGLAMQKTGMAEILAERLLSITGDEGWLMISVLYILTGILSAFLSNNATAVLLAPIALSLAAEVGVSPKPLLVAVAFGASASFATPIGYQTNLLVMGPGGYRFRDYVRIGVPLTILLWITATLLIPIFWPLNAI